MTKRATLTDVATGYNSAVTLNENFHSLNERFDNTVSLDGSTPNALQADLDLNYNDLLNVNLFDTKELRINGEKVTSITTVPYWAGGWEPQTTYAKNVLVRESGNSYISLEEHTSSLSFSNDLSAGRWELFASRGSAGAGTGDMLSSANLSDLDDVSIARNNLGLGTMATETASDYTLVASLGPLATGTLEDHQVKNPLNTNDNPWLWSGSDVKTAVDHWASGFGIGQEWVDVQSNRSMNTSYQNQTGKPIMVSLAGGSGGTCEVSVNGSDWVTAAVSHNTSGDRRPVSFIVPDTHYYRLRGSGGIGFWSELR